MFHNSDSKVSNPVNTNANNQNAAVMPEKRPEKMTTCELLKDPRLSKTENAWALGTGLSFGVSFWTFVNPIMLKICSVQDDDDLGLWLVRGGVALFGLGICYFSSRKCHISELKIKIEESKNRERELRDQKIVEALTGEKGEDLKTIRQKEETIRQKEEDYKKLEEKHAADNKAKDQEFAAQKLEMTAKQNAELQKKAEEYSVILNKLFAQLGSFAVRAELVTPLLRKGVNIKSVIGNIEKEIQERNLTKKIAIQEIELETELKRTHLKDKLRQKTILQTELKQELTLAMDDFQTHLNSDAKQSNGLRNRKKKETLNTAQDSTDQQNKKGWKSKRREAQEKLQKAIDMGEKELSELKISTDQEISELEKTTAKRIDKLQKEINKDDSLLQELKREITEQLAQIDLYEKMVMQGAEMKLTPPTQVANLVPGGMVPASPNALQTGVQSEEKKAEVLPAQTSLPVNGEQKHLAPTETSSSMPASIETPSNVIPNGVNPTNRPASATTRPLSPNRGNLALFPSSPRSQQQAPATEPSINLPGQLENLDNQVALNVV